jgi:c-di-GMP-binding flagellar brake protein YcgR
VINYDIHWNPVRLIQRFGRVDRINSQNEEVSMINFGQPRNLTSTLNLRNRVEARMALVDISATGSDNLLTEVEVSDELSGELNYRDAQLKRMKDEVLQFRRTQ